MTVRMYSSLDTGAPSIPNISSQRLIDNLRLILTAALVDGYGSQPAAGWTLAHSHADGFSLSNGEGIITFVHQAVSTVTIYAMEAITDSSTALPGGLNRRSGPWFDGESTASRQLYTSNFSGNSGTQSWAVVADDKTVTLLSQGGTALLDPTWQSAQALHFGRYYPVSGGVGFIVLGGATSTGSGMSLWSGSTSVAGISLRNPFTGLIDQGAAPAYLVYGRAGMGVTQQQAYSRTDICALQLFRAGVAAMGASLSAGTAVAGAVYAGALRGLMIAPFLGAARFEQALKSLGVATPVPADRLKALSVGGKLLWPLHPSQSELGGFVSLDDVDWAPLWT